MGLGAGSWEHTAPRRATEGSTPVSQEAEGEGDCGENLYHGFHRKERVSRLYSRALGTQEITEAGSMGHRVR